MQGIEFKLDKVFQTTGNLWIETAERNDPKIPYSSSGIFRKDNSWLYCIGNYDVLYIFQTNILIGICRSERYPIIENNLMTSKGFLLPKHEADKCVVNETAEGKSE